MLFNIKDLREDHDFIQYELASKLGISQRGYFHYEKGYNVILTEILIRLAEIYQTSTNYILGLTNQREKQSHKSNEEKVKS